EARSEVLARQILSAWFAGHALANGREAAGNTILIRNVLSVWDSMEAALQTRFASMALHEEYPLDESDFFWDQPDMTYLDAADRLISKRTPDWLFGFRKTTNATNERTVLMTVLPRFAVPDKFPLISFGESSAKSCVLVCCNANSFVLDYIARQKVAGTDMSHFYIQQLPVLTEAHYSETVVEQITLRFLELTFTA